MEYIIIITVFWGAIILAILLHTTFFKNTPGYKNICAAVIIAGVVLFEIIDVNVSEEQMFNIIASVDVLIWIAIVGTFVSACFRKHI